MAQFKSCLTAESADFLTTRTISEGSIWKKIAMEKSFYSADSNKKKKKSNGGGIKVTKEECG